MPFLSQLFLYTGSSVMVVSSRFAEWNGRFSGSFCWNLNTVDSWLSHAKIRFLLGKMKGSGVVSSKQYVKTERHRARKDSMCGGVFWCERKMGALRVCVSIRV